VRQSSSACTQQHAVHCPCRPYTFSLLGWGGAAITVGIVACGSRLPTCECRCLASTSRALCAPHAQAPLLLRFASPAG
jgi:hypothetical protein